MNLTLNATFNLFQTPESMASQRNLLYANRLPIVTKTDEAFVVAYSLKHCNSSNTSFISTAADIAMSSAYKTDDHTNKYLSANLLIVLKVLTNDLNFLTTS